MPERYHPGSFSRRRSGINILNFAERRLGWEERILLLRRHQLSERVFDEGDLGINFKFAQDAAQYLSRRLGDPGIPREIGRHACATHKSGTFGQALSRAGGCQPAFELMILEFIAKYLENNYVWTLERLGSEGCRISGYPGGNLYDAFPDLSFLDPVLCEIRAGFFEGVPLYLNEGAASVRHTRCVCHGDPACVFDVTFPLRKLHQGSRSLSLLSGDRPVH